MHTGAIGKPMLTIFVGTHSSFAYITEPSPKLEFFTHSDDMEF